MGLSPKNLKEEIKILNEVVSDARNDLTVVYVGGVPTDLLNAPDIQFDIPQKRVHTEEGHIAAKRKDGTNRDIDLLCLSDKKDQVEEFRRAVATRIGSVTNSDEFPQVSITAYADKVRRAAFFQLISQVSKDDEGIHLSIGSIDEVIDPALFEDAWTIDYNSLELPILHPVAHAYNYRIRSIAGLRSKDAEKVTQLEATLHKHMDESIFEDFSPFLRLERNIRSELSLRRAIEIRSLHRATLSLGKLAMRSLESNPALLSSMQKQSRVLSALVHAVMLHSSGNFTNTTHDQY